MIVTKISLLILLILLITTSSQAATCTSQGTTPQAASVNGTWNCGHVPSSSDDIIIATPVYLDTGLSGDALTGNTVTFNGATAHLGTDGLNAYTLTSNSSGATINVDTGCSTTTSACVTPYIIDTCTNSSAGKEVTFAATGLTNGQYIFTGGNNGAIQINICHAIMAAGSGGTLSHTGQSGVLDASHWNIATTKFTGTGKQFHVNALGNIALNNWSWAGGSDYFWLVTGVEPSVCTFNNGTVTGNTFVGEVFQDQSGPPFNCTVDSLAFETTTQTYAVSGMLHTTNSIMKSTYSTGTTQNACGVCLQGTSGHVSTASNNAIDGFLENIWSFAYSSDDHNFLVQNNGIALGQGSLFADGHICPSTSSYDILTVDNDPFAGNSLLTLGADSTHSSCNVYDHLSVYQGLQHGAGGIETIALGEFTGSVDLPVTNGQFSNSIVVSGNYGIRNRDSLNTFVTTGTGSVGIFNNDVYNPAAISAGQTAYQNPYSTSNFDNGTTAHPNAIYGDLTQQNPNWVNITKRFPDCDLQLGGAGTQANMFDTVMFNRWTGAAPLYTPTQVYNCLTAGWVPTNSAIFTASTTGGYIGALAPVSTLANSVISGPVTISGNASIK